MTTKHYFIYTFGCAMNEYDTERIAAALEAKGYIPSDKVNDSDFIVLILLWAQMLYPILIIL